MKSNYNSFNIVVLFNIPVLSLVFEKCAFAAVQCVQSCICVQLVWVCMTCGFDKLHFYEILCFTRPLTLTAMPLQAW